MKVINLLPKPRQEELHYDAALHGLWIMIVLSLLSFALVFAAQFGTRLYLRLQAGSIHGEIAALQAAVNQQQNSDVKDRVQTANNLIGDYNNLAAAAPKWSNIIKAFVPLPPAGVRINSFNVDPSSHSVAITGLSPTRDLVIQLYNNILADKHDFYGLDYPLENVVQPVNVNFHFEFYFYPDLIK